MQKILETPRLKRRDGVAVDRVLIKAFQNDFHGQIVQQGDASYDTTRRIWNASIDKHPGLIARCLGAADIVVAVKFARANDLLVAVRSGGHNVAGRALCDDGIVIDLSAMKGIFVDPRLRTVRGSDAGRRRSRDAYARSGGPDRRRLTDGHRRPHARRRRRVAGAQIRTDLR
jgi:FAD binding domain